MTEQRPTVAFICVQNAGRSQMAAAFAQRENERRQTRFRILSCGTRPAEKVHPEVVQTMAEAGIDLRQKKPGMIDENVMEQADYIITMGCDAGDVCPVEWYGDSRDWNLEDPHGKDIATVRRIRDRIEEKVSSLFDELEATSA